MLQLYDLNKRKVEGLVNYKDYKIESVLDTGDKTLSFLYPSILSENILEECYIKNKNHEFVIKEVKDDGKWKSVVAVMNVEDLEGQAWEHFDCTNQNIEQCLTLAVAGTGWTVEMINPINKKRTVKKTNCSSWDLIQEAKKVYRVEIEFDTLNKIVKVYEKLGSKKGAYFIDFLNLKELEVEANSYDYYTRILAIGKNDIKVLVENYQYSKKVKTLIWKDEKYTDIDSLKEDAILKLNELSKPYKSYRASIIDLASISDKYKNILDYKLGDIIILISRDLKIKEEQRIVKIVEYPDDHTKNDCEMANTTLSFKELQKEFKDTSDTVSNITEDNGKISEKSVQGAVQNLTVNKADINDFNAAVGRIGKLEVNKLDAEVANLKFVNIDKALIDVAYIDDLEANNIKVDILEGGTANLQSILTNFISGENGQLVHLTSENVVIDNAVIKSAMIENLDLAKLNAGDISTNKFRIISDSGKMLIADNTIQINDSNRTRVQIGKDGSNDYNMYIWDTSGKLMFDAAGLKADGIKSKIIRDDMITDNANINGSKINISSLVTEVNKDTNTSLFKASKIMLDTIGQSLEISFNSLKSNVDNIDGRNLLLNSGAELDLKYWTKQENNGEVIIEQNDVYYGKKAFRIKQSSGTAYQTLRQDIKVKPGDKIAISGFIKVLQVINSSSAAKIGCNYYRADGSMVGGINQPTLNTVGDYKKINFNLVIPNEAVTLQIILFTQGGEAIFDNIKVEKDRCTDWTPAQEDVDQKIESNTTSINLVQGQIDTLIKDTTIEENGATVKLKDSYSSLKQTVNGINTTVASHTSSISGLNSSVSTMQSSITQLNNEITQKVEQTDITNAINSIEIGGRNLLRNSSLSNISFPYTSDEYNWRAASVNPSSTVLRTRELIMDCLAFPQGIYGIKCINTNTTYENVDIAQDLRVMEDGETYTLSAYFKLIKGTASFALQYGMNPYPAKTVVGSTEWKKYTFTFVYDKTQFSNNLKTNIYFGIRGNSFEGYCCGFELEKGGKATDWTPALEDIDSSISAVDGKVNTLNVTVSNTVNKVATIETNLTSITSRVSATESSITTINGNVTSLQTRMSTAEQKITDSAIIATVSSTINNAKTEAINSANNTTDNKLKSYATTSSLTQTSDSIVAKFSSSGGYNLLKNSNFANTSTDGWFFWGSAYRWSTSSYYKEVGDMYIANSGTTPGGLWQSGIPIKPNTKYTLSVLCTRESNVKGASFGLEYCDGKECTNILISQAIVLNFDGKRNSYTFTIPNNSSIKYLKCGFRHDGVNTTGTGGYLVRINKPCLAEGEVSIWSASPFEVIDGNTQISGDGVTINNGALTIKNNAGTNVLTGDINGNLTITGTFVNKNYNNVKAIEIDNTNITFFDWERNGRELGYIYSSYLLTYPNCRGFSLAHNNDGYLTLGYKSTNDSGAYIIFDKYSKNPNYAAPIRFLESAVFSEAVNMQDRVYISNTMYLGNNASTTTPMIFGTNNRLVMQVSVTNKDDGLKIQTNTGGVLAQILAGYSYPILLNNSTQVSGNFTVTGSKNSLQKTEHYGNRLINAYETAEYFFGDIGSGIIKDGECLIHIDEIFKECINTNCEYHVFTQVYEGSISKVKRFNNYFIVYGEENTKFSWELKAKRKGYENVRLDAPEIGTIKESAIFSEEDFVSNTSEEILTRDLSFNLEDILMEG